MPLTQAGVVLGTPAYMAPEQADIWAFGFTSRWLSFTREPAA